MLVMKGLRQIISVGRVIADLGQGRLRQHYIARRKSVCIFEESPPSVSINGVVLRTTKDGGSNYK